MWISRKKFEEMKTLSERQVQTLEAVRASVDNASVLIGIDRNGRENIFTFRRNGQTHQIKTMGLISDDINEWKQELLR